MERTSLDADPLNSVEMHRSVSETFVQDNTKMMDELDAKGCTPLHWAIWRCFHQKKEKAEEAKQTIRLLLRSGADPNAAIAAAAPPPVDAMDEEGKEAAEGASGDVAFRAPTVEGRVGPERVRMNEHDKSNETKISKDGLQVYNSARLTYLLGTMGSVRSNVKVTSGCWFYEVVIGTENLYQIGWSSKDTKFTRSEGVGDDKYSYAFDGYRRLKWHRRGFWPWGDKWKPGDILGCGLDADRKEIMYWLNGKYMGVAFSDVELRDGLYAGVSIETQHGAGAHHDYDDFILFSVIVIVIINFLIAEPVGFFPRVVAATAIRHRFTALHEASFLGLVDVARMLLEEGKADVQATDAYQRTALHLAAITGDCDMIKLLFSAGAVLQSTDDCGRTPLHLAAMHGHLAAVQYLVGQESSILARDNNSWIIFKDSTPLHLAAARGHTDVVLFLLETSFGKNIVALEDDDDVEEFLESDDDEWDEEEEEEEAEENKKEGEEAAGATTKEDATPAEVLAEMVEAAALKNKAKRERHRRRRMKDSLYLSRYLKNADGNTFLHLAVANGHTETARRILELLNGTEEQQLARRALEQQQELKRQKDAEDAKTKEEKEKEKKEKGEEVDVAIIGQVEGGAEEKEKERKWRRKKKKKNTRRR
ncbi:SPRY and ankyrin domain containing protein [Acanthamoeba castellanii str. Neff]|uniref:SPRY and ankyrin domain containing protein n=1 Tax=Acanthamoeba castellanii (strain ATCC 30010 / Neff) TaxID=1257118 RepID=L8GV90_ACACF|nr:SPRY and ankyrin domain containing protein [Acanthamoeba castellanii str. Neff]ELR16935.1 SPRY and ankyrin domain containing protein [Acanthamoeba castellanii str. Neff]